MSSSHERCLVIKRREAISTRKRNKSRSTEREIIIKSWDTVSDADASSIPPYYPGLTFRGRPVNLAIPFSYDLRHDELTEGKSVVRRVTRRPQRNSSQSYLRIILTRAVRPSPSNEFHISTPGVSSALLHPRVPRITIRFSYVISPSGLSAYLHA